MKKVVNDIPFSFDENPLKNTSLVILIFCLNVSKLLKEVSAEVIYFWQAYLPVTLKFTNFFNVIKSS